MITKEKLEIYKYYKGYFDGYYVQNKNDQRIIADEEWLFLNDLMQDLFMLRKGIAAAGFAKQIIHRMSENCDDRQTCTLLVKLEKELYG